jgi:YD repeat-containing protein
VTRSALRMILLTTAISCPGLAQAQDATTYVEAFNVPVFESIDQNGVDLITGSMRISTPVLEMGSEHNKHVLGLQWSGKGWVFVGRPTIWRDGDKYIVNYLGRSEEFNNRSSNYSQRKPISGASLSCVTWSGGLTSECAYTSREGDFVHFKGMYSPITPYPSAYSDSTYAWGNIGMAEALVYSIDRGNRRFGAASPGAMAEYNYYKRDVTLTLGQQTLKITTPNHDNDSSEHYLRPDNTTQTVTDSYGSVWRYTVNDDRRLTGIVTPDGASVSISYNNGKVASVTNASGTWTYSYTTPGDYGTTTVTNPLGEQTYVKYHRDRGYVTESRDALYRWTYYTYDAGHRPSRITYPEGNYVDYTYDARGNITTKVIAPKPTIGGPALVERAGYDATCADPVICNLPRWTEDPRLGRTDYEYAPSTKTAAPFYGNSSQTWPLWFGTARPITVTSPAVGGIRPQVRNTHLSWMPVRSSTCLTQASCAGTADEVVTTFDWGGTETTTRYLFGKAVTANGVTLRTCYGYDNQGRVISETPPNAGLASCPASVTAAPAVTATMPSPGTYAVAPTFPDGTTGTGGGGGGGGGGGEPVDPPCGYGGVICP